MFCVILPYQFNNILSYPCKNTIYRRVKKLHICSTYKREKQPFQQKPKFSLIILNKMFNAFLCNFPMRLSNAYICLCK